MELYEKQNIAEEMNSVISALEQALEHWNDNDENSAVQLFNVGVLNAKRLSRRLAFLRHIAREIDTEKQIRGAE
ncbi:hypothetical protein QV08_11590 [Gallibacterium salpingitidis]|uniref:Uncharacterized protein n=1 Tax=Gallibacterium salpingitidis TaxID=505341 RepID=A0AB36E1T4_9PAST|nr:hypothetical protein [Gallibacterium salpingitidis]OBX05802.1 hypothetical protein QV08_11590 [Gallibacterium salpingitidis]OBX09727.1 hypothetical protein QV09_07570 [Gallibacterium salpingitidis]